MVDNAKGRENVLPVCGGGNSVICKKKAPVTEEMSGNDEDSFLRQQCEEMGVQESANSTKNVSHWD